jgi:hypothetical protein
MHSSIPETKVMVRTVASKGEYDAARGRVAAGAGTARDHELVAREAQQAGSRGNAAREAAKQGSKLAK